MRVISFCTRFHAPSSIRFSIVCHNHPQTHSSCYFRHDNHQMEPCELSANTVIAHPRALTDKMTLIRDAGPSKFQVIADFDATLTRYRVNGLRGRQTSHGLLQQGDAYYDAKRQALYDHYHPLEISPVIPIDEKTKLMEEWYILLFLSITFGLSFDTLVWTNK
jgi:5'-nucleotidase